MKRIGRIAGILLVVGLLFGLVPPALAAVDTGQTVPALPHLDTGQSKDKAKLWHLWGQITVLKGTVREATLVDGEIIMELEEGQTIKVSEDAVKGPVKSRIWGGIESPEALEGAVVVALAHYDEETETYIARHAAIIPDVAALAKATYQKPSLLPKVIRLKGTIDGILSSTIIIDTGDTSQSITYDEETVVVIKAATGLEIGEEVTVIALEEDGGLLAKGIFAGLEPVQVTQWLQKYRMQWSERHRVPWLERYRAGNPSG
ncbi:MAG: hypothetical protein JW732_02845 [Dehalococcoidia bacterium]|nr:hypothetical protein [Dehalococcoidia bacterium]